jgi:hypothetical protein
MLPIGSSRRWGIAVAANSTPGRRGQDALFAFDLAKAQDSLDACDLALGFNNLTRRLEPLRLALEAEAEQVVLNFPEEQIQLLVGLFSEVGRLAHNVILLSDS